LLVSCVVYFPLIIVLIYNFCFTHTGKMAQLVALFFGRFYWLKLSVFPHLKHFLSPSLEFLVDFFLLSPLLPFSYLFTHIIINFIGLKILCFIRCRDFF
jgi:hypothetical protein